MGVDLFDVILEDGWLIQVVIDVEVVFMWCILVMVLGCILVGGYVCFGWGEVWVWFDLKGFMVSSGICYLFCM